MKIVIQNTVREPSTRDLRRQRPGDVVASPLISGVRLPPRRSRTVESTLLNSQDVGTICRLIACGVVRVFSATPYTLITAEDFRKMYPEVTPDAAAPAVDAQTVVVPDEAPQPTDPPVIEQELAQLDEPVQLEEPASEEPVASVDVPAAGDLRAELTATKNADLRVRLASLGGGNGVGLSKAQLVDEILALLAGGQ
jgi:hypothetical protein